MLLVSFCPNAFRGFMLVCNAVLRDLCSLQQSCEEEAGCFTLCFESRVDVRVLRRFLVGHGLFCGL